MQNWDVHADKRTSNFKCNRFILSPKESNESGGDDKNTSSITGTSVPLNSILKSILSDQQVFLHYYIR